MLQSEASRHGTQNDDFGDKKKNLRVNLGHRKNPLSAQINRLTGIGATLPLTLEDHDDSPTIHSIEDATRLSNLVRMMDDSYKEV